MQTGQAVKPKTSGPFLSCEGCGHVRVCTIYRAISPLLGNWTEDSKPFEPGAIASICREYVSATLLGTLSEGSSDL